MKLNTDILFDYLGKTLELTRYGRGKKKLHLGRPQFYDGSSKTFISDNLYIAMADRLPEAPLFGDGVVVVCVGGLPPVWYTNEKCVCFSVGNNTDIFAVFNTVQQLFDKFDSWDAELLRILDSGADISEMVELSMNIVGTPMIVLDKKFKLIACNSVLFSTENKAEWPTNEDGVMPLNAFSKAMENNKIDLTSRAPYIMAGEHNHLALNLFSKHRTYIGSLTFHTTTRGPRPSDYMLIEYLGRLLEKAIAKLPPDEDDRLSMLKHVFSNLLQGLPYNPKRLERLERLESQKANAIFVCLKMVMQGKMRSAPLEFVCNLVESTIPNSSAVQYESDVVILVETEPGDGEEEITRLITEFSEKTDVRIGVSQLFSNLLRARFYYRQASIAIEYSDILWPEKRYVFFSDCSLTYLLTHSTGEFPIDILMPEGIKRIQAWDEQSGKDHMHTLKVYLDNNMSVSRTAEALFLHRSSLIDRLKRIQKMLGVDLEDPEQRLHIQVLIKADELNRTIKKMSSTDEK